MVYFYVQCEMLHLNLRGRLVKEGTSNIHGEVTTRCGGTDGYLWGDCIQFISVLIHNW